MVFHLFCHCKMVVEHSNKWNIIRVSFILDNHIMQYNTYYHYSNKISFILKMHWTTYKVQLQSKIAINQMLFQHHFVDFPDIWKITFFLTSWMWNCLDNYSSWTYNLFPGQDLLTLHQIWWPVRDIYVIVRPTKSRKNMLYPYIR